MDCYQKGKNLLDIKCFDEAEQCFKNGFSEGDIRCAYGLLAVHATQEHDCTPYLKILHDVFPKLENMAKKNDADACFIIGRCYETGSTVNRNMQTALEYYVKAAELNNLDAMFNLGCNYINLGPCGYVLAKIYFSAAAKQGHHHAQMAISHFNKMQNDTK